MKFLWIGSFASDDMFDNMPAKSIGQASGVTSQRSFISGIDQIFNNSDYVLDTLNVQGIPSYPIYPEKRYNEFVWSRTGKSKDISIGFTNKKYIKTISQFHGLRIAAINWARRIPREEKIHVIVYEPVYSRLSAALKIKRKHKNTDVTVIVPDIPEYVGQKGNIIKQILKYVRGMIVKWKLKHVDKYILYAEKMAEYYHIDSSKYVVVEGSIDYRDAKVLETNRANNEKLSMLYSGAITKGRGIPEFVEAFRHFDNANIQLWLTGSGNYETELKRISEKDERIKYFGFLKTRKEVLEIEARADALLHIRSKDEISSTYCFPSKLFEYLASGKPVLSVKIPGIPEEYFKYMIEIKSLDDQGVADGIGTLLSKTPEERDEIGKRGREFVMKYKNSRYQANKILDFVLNTK